MSAQAYLEWERRQTSKHEFDGGSVFAMAGGSPRHNFLTAAITGELRSAVAASDCRVLSSDQRISAKRGERYVYPDAVAVCGGLEMEPGTHDVLANPTVVIEVLSASTEAYDRGGKWALYQVLTSLTDYVLLSQTSRRVEHFRRTPDGGWQYEVVGEELVLASGARPSVSAIYRGAFELDAD